MSRSAWCWRWRSASDYCFFIIIPHSPLKRRPCCSAWMLDGAIPIPKTIVSTCGSGEEPPGCRHSSTTTVLRTARRRGDGWLGDVGPCYAVAAAYPAAVSVPQPIVGLTSQRCRIAYSKAASNWSSRPAWAAIFRIATLTIESLWPTPRATSARTRRIAGGASELLPLIYTIVVA
jgi:hypothetical protein